MIGKLFIVSHVLFFMNQAVVLLSASLRRDGRFPDYHDSG